MHHHEVGRNPFLPVIMITGTPGEELVGKVINSGTDDLLVEMISPAISRLPSPNERIVKKSNTIMYYCVSPAIQSRYSLLPPVIGSEITQGQS